MQSSYQVVFKAAKPWKQHIMNIQKRIAEFDSDDLIKTRTTDEIALAQTGADMFRLLVTLNLQVLLCDEEVKSSSHA
eukprot:275830-Karenia_brevis.AAC.1